MYRHAVYNVGLGFFGRVKLNTRQARFVGDCVYFRQRSV